MMRVRVLLPPIHPAPGSHRGGVVEPYGSPDSTASTPHLAR